MRTLALASAAWLAACQANTFPLELKGEATVAADPSGAPLNAFPTIGNFTNVDFRQNPDIKFRQVSQEQINSVKPSSITLKILSPLEQDFAFLDRLEFFVKSGDEQVLVAERDGIALLDLPLPQPELRLDVKDVELHPYITAPSASVIIRGQGRHPKVATQVQATVVLTVELKLF